MSITLPTPENNSGSNDWSDVYNNDIALKEGIEEVQAERLLNASSFVNASAEGLTRTDTSYGSFSTPIKATLESVAANAMVGIVFTGFMKGGTTPALQITTSAGTPESPLGLEKVFNTYTTGHYAGIITSYNGLSKIDLDLGTSGAGDFHPLPVYSQACFVVLSASEGERWVEIQGKAASGTITVKYPKLYVWEIG